MASVILDTELRLGDGARIDDGATVGYAPGRGDQRVLEIGPGARVRLGTIIYGGSVIGSDLETGHNVVIREGNVIGDSFRIWGNSAVTIRRIARQ